MLKKPGALSQWEPCPVYAKPRVGSPALEKKEVGKGVVERKKKKVEEDSKEDKTQRNTENIYLILHFTPKGSDLASRITILFYAHYNQLKLNTDLVKT